MNTLTVTWVPAPSGASDAEAYVVYESKMRYAKRMAAFKCEGTKSESSLTSHVVGY